MESKENVIDIPLCIKCAHYAYWNGDDTCVPDMKLLAYYLQLPTVPVLWEGKISSEQELKTLVDYYVTQPSAYGETREGVVIRIANEFPVDEFSHYVCKWVRPNHVTTDEHWTKNWKKAKLCV